MRDTDGIQVRPANTAGAEFRTDDTSDPNAAAQVDAQAAPAEGDSDDQDVDSIDGELGDDGSGTALPDAVEGDAERESEGRQDAIDAAADAQAAELNVVGDIASGEPAALEPKPELDDPEYAAKHVDADGDGLADHDRGSYAPGYEPTSNPGRDPFQGGPSVGGVQDASNPTAHDATPTAAPNLGDHA